MDALQRDHVTLSTEALQDMSRGKLKHYLTLGYDGSDDYLCNVRSLWRALLATMLDSSIVDEHLVAVCNTICVFLQSASSSKEPAVRRFAMLGDTWMAVFDALLRRFDSGKLKALRQVLKTLIKILRQQDDASRARSIQDDVLFKIAVIIQLGQPVAYLRASLIIFEAFIRSDIPGSRILSALGRCHGSIHESWDLCLRRRAIDVNELRLVTNHHFVDESICDFILSVLLAVADSNVQATAGTFLINFVSIFSEYDIPLASLWVELVIVVLHRYPKGVEPFKNYLLPSLFELHPQGFHSLLQRMAAMYSDSSNLQNFLTIAVLGVEVGLSASGGTSHPLNQLIGAHL